ncbi:hypothetical protein CEXT_358541 [Caerostris extrusa]|uniref:Prolactin receptor n=1 Tax=Caerostris extrusa TaxID=172846 RepID=A0AAV4XEA3_CAEEX|nr:hypothetical protein CEXT_358541 [Caerostris extrusa]
MAKVMWGSRDHVTVPSPWQPPLENSLLTRSAEGRQCEGEASSYLKDPNIALFKPSPNILTSERPEIQAEGEKLLQSTDGPMEIPNRAHPEAFKYLKDPNIALFKPSPSILPSQRPERQAGGGLLQSTNGTMEIPNRAHPFNDDGREQRSLRFRTKHSFPK